MKLQSSASVVVATFAVAGHSTAAAPVQEQLPITCPWKVTSDDFIVNSLLVIQQSNPGRDCDFFNKTMPLHLDTCEQCSNMHDPCNHIFSACIGCCQSVNALRELNCDDFKDYFRWQNERSLNLMEANLHEEPDTAAILTAGTVIMEAGTVLQPAINEPDTSAVMRPVIKDHSPAKVQAESSFTRHCSVVVEQFYFPKVPTIVHFDCRQCNIGNADLLAKCCNECVRFSTSETLANMTMIEPFVICDGCQTATISIPLEGTATQQPWVHAGKYDDYSRESQEDRMDRWVDDKMCSKFSKDTCANPPRQSGRLLREVASTTTTTTRETLAAQCLRLLASTTDSASMTTAAPAMATIIASSSIAAGDKIVEGANAATSLKPEDSMTSDSVAMSVFAAMTVMVCSCVLV